MIKEDLLSDLAIKNEVIIELHTDLDMVQKSRVSGFKNTYYNKVKKHQKIRCKTNFNYQEEVNKQRILESKMPDFITGELIQGDIIQRNPTLIKTKKGEILLQLIVLEQIEKHFYFNGGEIPEHVLEQYFLKESENKSQGLDNPIVIISLNIKNIVNVF